jgi:hypothetical protein
MLRPMSRFGPLVLLLLVCACSESEVVRVRICGGVDVPGEIDGLRVVTRDETGAERTVGFFELLRCPEETVRELPVDLTLPTSKGARWIAVQGLRLGLEVLTAEVRLEGGRGQAEIWLDSSCLRLECPRGQSCNGGMCAISLPADAVLGSCEAGAPPHRPGPQGDPADAATEGSEADGGAGGADPGAEEEDTGADDVAESSDPGADRGLCAPQGGAQ